MQIRACLEPLAQLFGHPAQRSRRTSLKDWAAVMMTYLPPQPQGRDWVSGPWRDRLSLGGSETSPSETGYLADALDAARLVVTETLDGMKIRKSD